MPRPPDVDCPPEVARRARARDGLKLIDRHPLTDGERFIVRGRREYREKSTYYVSIGPKSRCTCDGAVRPCKHLAYIFLDILGLDPKDARWWQRRLSTEDVEDILKMGQPEEQEEEEETQANGDGYERRNRPKSRASSSTSSSSSSINARNEGSDVEIPTDRRDGGGRSSQGGSGSARRDAVAHQQDQASASHSPPSSQRRRRAASSASNLSINELPPPLKQTQNAVAGPATTGRARKSTVTRRPLPYQPSQSPSLSRSPSPRPQSQPRGRESDAESDDASLPDISSARASATAPASTNSSNQRKRTAPSLSPSRSASSSASPPPPPPSKKSKTTASRNSAIKSSTPGNSSFTAQPPPRRRRSSSSASAGSSTASRDAASPPPQTKRQGKSTGRGLNGASGANRGSGQSGKKDEGNEAKNKKGKDKRQTPRSGDSFEWVEGELEEALHSLDRVKASQQYSRSHSLTTQVNGIINTIVRSLTSSSSESAFASAFDALLMVGNAIVETQGEIGRALQEECPPKLAKALGSTWKSLSDQDKRSDFPGVKTLADALEELGVFGLQEAYDKMELDLEGLDEDYGDMSG